MSMLHIQMDLEQENQMATS